MSVGESPPLGTDPLISHVVADRYRVLRKLGEGGMGAVYLAEHVVIEKKLVLKVLAPELTRRQDLVARFLQEARSASRIGHENVIDISDFGQSSEGYVYIAMEYLDGKDLGEVVRAEGALPWPRVQNILVQICRALRAAHDKGIVHRDMKPENIFLIDREGRPEFVKILDFGIAKVMGVDPNGPRLTRTGMIFGTPEYMSPEQAEGKEADHRVDVYAVGCIAYHLMTGSTPFSAENFMALLTKHLMEDPVPPSVRRPDLHITAEMDVMVLKALEKDRDRRYQNMGEFLEVASSCHGPEGESTSQSMGGFTREMGGAHAKAQTSLPAPAKSPTRVGNASERASDTELVSRDVVDAAASARPRAPGADRSVHKMVLAAIGVALGVFAALYFVLSRGRQPAPSPAPAVEAKVVPTAPAQPVPAASPINPPTPTAAVAPVEPVPAQIPPPRAEAAPVAAPAPAAASAPGPAARKAKGHVNMPVSKAGTVGAPAPALPRPAPSRPAPPPSDLKPFPGM